MNIILYFKRIFENFCQNPPFRRTCVQKLGFQVKTQPIQTKETQMHLNELLLFLRSALMVCNISLVNPPTMQTKHLSFFKVENVLGPVMHPDGNEKCFIKIPDRSFCGGLMLTQLW